MADCPGEPGFECLDTIYAKGLCRRCYKRALYRNNPEYSRGVRRKAREYYHENRAVVRAKQKKYYGEHREDIIDNVRRWYEIHRDDKREYDRYRREEKIDELRAYDRQRAKRPARRRHKTESDRRRRARKKHTQIVPFTDDELVARLSMFAGCWMCGEVADTVDHLIPLSRGGPHCLSNLRPACLSCNASKGAKTPSEWAASQSSWSITHQPVSHLQRTAMASGSGGLL